MFSEFKWINKTSAIGTDFELELMDHFTPLASKVMSSRSQLIIDPVPTLGQPGTLASSLIQDSEPSELPHDVCLWV